MYSTYVLSLVKTMLTKATYCLYTTDTRYWFSVWLSAGGRPSLVCLEPILPDGCAGVDVPVPPEAPNSTAPRCLSIGHPTAPIHIPSTH